MRNGDRVRILGAVAAVALTLGGCGGDDDGGNGKTSSGDISPEYKAALANAASPKAADFPATKGRTLQAVASAVQPGAQVGLATSVLVPGENRLAFGMIGPDQKLIYGPSAVYVAPTPKAKARGPFLAPADSLVTEPAFRSQNAAAESDAIAAIYAAAIQFDKPGKAAVLTVTDVNGKLIGGTTQVNVLKDDPVVSVGDEAPNVATDTLASLGGDEEKLCTREPIDDMHGESLDEVLGEKPVALLFATPQLCQSRVCGPVVDIAEQLKQQFGGRIEFIHQEVYVDNDVNKGLRDPLKAFGLPTEPWLFVIDASSTVTARLEGSFGVNAFREAVQTAL
jgi:hypothetical protein